MPLELFTISSTNPNEAIGGGGCACHPLKVSGCKGPYAIFRGPGTEQPLSPYNVVGIKCLQRATDKAENDEAVPVGESGYVEPTEDTVERFLVEPRKDTIPRV